MPSALSTHMYKLLYIDLHISVQSEELKDEEKKEFIECRDDNYVMGYFSPDSNSGDSDDKEDVNVKTVSTWLTPMSLEKCH